MKDSSNKYDKIICGDTLALSKSSCSVLTSFLRDSNIFGSQTLCNKKSPQTPKYHKSRIQFHVNLFIFGYVHLFTNYTVFNLLQSLLPPMTPILQFLFNSWKMQWKTLFWMQYIYGFYTNSLSDKILNFLYYFHKIQFSQSLPVFFSL